MSNESPTPPAWAESIFMTLLSAQRAETESGDLLEAYRDEQLPARGRLGADWWYIRQVIVVFARSYGLWLAALAAIFVAGDTANIYRPGAARWHYVPVVLVCVMIGASLQGGWRTRRMEGGLLVGVVTSALLWLFMTAWWLTTWYLFLPTQQVDPYWVQAWHYSAEPGETFVHWIFWDNVGATIVSGFVLGASGAAVGVVGGLAGAAARRLRRV